jgi:hypothetical protein
LELLLMVSVMLPDIAFGDSRVLIIGVDGAGGRFLANADTPNIDAIANDGAAHYAYLNEGALFPSPPSGYGASGVNWSTITTGASAAHHGVVDNSFAGSRFNQFPHFFKYIKAANPNAYTASIVDWGPINEEILANQYADLEIQNVSDSAVRDAAVTLLTSGDPDAVFLHFDQVDAAGHAYQWGSNQYYSAIHIVDSLIGDIMAALLARPGVISGQEDWLIEITADHGGDGFSHFASQGLINWEIPFIVGGPDVPAGAVLPQGTLRDVATTALWHFGVAPWNTTVDGQVRGLTQPLDLNLDGAVDVGDYAAFLAGYQTSLAGKSLLERDRLGDLDADGKHTVRDFAVFKKQFDGFLGAGAFEAQVGAVSSLPEPSAAIVLVAAGLFGFGFRRAAFGETRPPGPAGPASASC